MRIKLSLLLFLTVVCLLQSTAQKVGTFSKSVDIGNPKNAGSADFEKKSHNYVLKGSGYNVWFNRDEFHYAYKKLAGDFIITADFSLVGKGVDVHRKTGWMIRESLADSVSFISSVLHGDGLTVLQWRVKAGMKMRDPEDEVFAKDKGYQTLQIERIGNIFTMRAAKPGQPMELIGAHEMPNFPPELFVGIFVCSHNPEIVEEASITKLKIENKHD